MHHTRRSGQSLAELLIGIAIGTVFLVGTSVVIAPALQTNKQAGKIQTEAELSGELAANIRSWAAGNWDNVLLLATGTANLYSLNASSSPFIVAGSSTVSSSSMTLYGNFSQAQSGAYGGNGDGTTESCSFGSNPSPGDLVVAAIDWWNSGGIPSSTITIQDGSGNNYAVVYSPDPSGGYGDEYIAYLSDAPSNANNTITATFGTDGAATIYCDDFSPSANYTVSLDGSAGFLGNASGTTVSAPTIPVSESNELLYAIADPGNSLTSVNSPWSDGGGETPPTGGFSDMAEYDLGASVNTPVGFGDSTNGDGYTSMGASFIAATSTSSTITIYATSTQSILINSVTYTRYFYVSNVYRDVNGNVTTTVSGNSYDPSTKLVTVVVVASTTPASPSFATNFYLTRNQDNVFDQTSWAGGAGQSSPVTVVGTNYANGTNVSISATGSIQLASGGGSCVL